MLGCYRLMQQVDGMPVVFWSGQVHYLCHLKWYCTCPGQSAAWQSTSMKKTKIQEWRRSRKVLFFKFDCASWKVYQPILDVVHGREEEEETKEGTFGKCCLCCGQEEGNAWNIPSGIALLPARIRANKSTRIPFKMSPHNFRIQQYVCCKCSPEVDNFIVSMPFDRCLVISSLSH